MPYNFNIGISYQKLYLKNITDDFGWFIGCGLGFDISENSNERIYLFPSMYYTTEKTISTNSNSDTRYTPSISMPLGIYYSFNPSFRIYAQINPNIYYSISSSNTSSYAIEYRRQYSSMTDYKVISSESMGNSENRQNTFGISNLSNSNASLTFVYRIIK